MNGRDLGRQLIQHGYPEPTASNSAKATGESGVAFLRQTVPRTFQLCRIQHSRFILLRFMGST